MRSAWVSVVASRERLMRIGARRPSVLERGRCGHQGAPQGLQPGRFAPSFTLGSRMTSTGSPQMPSRSSRPASNQASEVPRHRRPVFESSPPSETMHRGAMASLSWEFRPFSRRPSARSIGPHTARLPQHAGPCGHRGEATPVRPAVRCGARDRRRRGRLPGRPRPGWGARGRCGRRPRCWRRTPWRWPPRR